MKMIMSFFGVHGIRKIVNRIILLREDNFGFCACHMISDYQYEKSAEYLEDQVNQKKEELISKI